MLGVQFAYITFCYVRQAFKLSASDRAGEGCGRGGGGVPPPTVGSFFIFRLQNVQSGAYLRRKFRLDDMYMGELVWN